MGYVATSLAAPTVKHAVIEALPIVIPYSLRVTNAAYVEVYKQTIDFTDIDYLIIRYVTGVTAGNGDFKCDVGGVNKFEDSPYADGTTRYHTIDCTGITGEQIFSLSCKHNGASTVWFVDFSMYVKEA